MSSAESSWLAAAADLPAEPDEPDEPDAEGVLAKLQEGALRLLAGLDRPPTSLRLRSDGVEIELEWPDPRPPAPVYVAAAAPAAAAAAAATPYAVPSPGAPGAPVAPVAQPESTVRFVTAHMVGTFYRAPSPGADPFVEPGDEIRPGQQVGIIEAMKLSIPIEADAAGRVVEILVENGAPVEFGDELMSYEPS
jgi:acetyl-CoA carboxylase biotin carboxyl carrier protein